MPIDPLVLRTRAAEAAGRLAEPAQCAALIRGLLADYANRVHRYSPRLAEGASAKEFKTPAPVLRAVVTALRGPAQARPEAALALARALWAGGSREERRLAAEVLGLAAPRAPAEVLAQLEAWLPELESGEAAEALAQFGLRPLLAADPYGYLDRARHWTADPRRGVRRLGVAVVTALAGERRWDDVPAALEILRNLMGERDAGVRGAVIAALHALTPRNPLAVAGFLREHAHRQDHNTHLILRAALRDLSPEARAELVRRMRS